MTAQKTVTLKLHTNHLNLNGKKKNKTPKQNLKTPLWIKIFYFSISFALLKPDTGIAQAVKWKDTALCP